MKRVNNEKVDIVILWVDGSDPIWNAKREKYSRELSSYENAGNSNIRFQSWDNLKLLFRAIDKCMPWVNKIFLVTDNQVPGFLDISNEKVRIIYHTDFIPAKYLPTFNANTIELNLFRIQELSENFIYFNDDTIPLKPVKKEYYFKNNKVCDEAVERAFCPIDNKTDSQLAAYRHANDMFIINRHFSKREVQRKNFFKWYNLKYGKKLLRTISLHYYYDFDFFTNPHLPSAMKKTTFQKIWNCEEDVLDISCRNRFRKYTDVNQYLIRFWQLCEGDFYPRRTKGKFYRISEKNSMNIANDIKKRKYPMISVNEVDDIKDFPKVKNDINEALEELFPNKSSFEK